MTTWNLTQNVAAETSIPTLKHTAYGDCFIGTTAVIPIYAIWIEVPAGDAAPTVRALFEPATAAVDLLDESLVTTTLVPPNHGGAASWGTVVVGGVRMTSIDFDIPASGTTWGWDFEPNGMPSPLKMKVRVKRL